MRVTIAAKKSSKTDPRSSEHSELVAALKLTMRARCVGQGEGRNWRDAACCEFRDPNTARVSTGAQPGGDLASPPSLVPGSAKRIVRSLRTGVIQGP